MTTAQPGDAEAPKPGACPFSGGVPAHPPMMPLPPLEPGASGGAVHGEFAAYSAWGFHVEIVPAWKHRSWMDRTAGRFAYHCLPMTMASQSGWFVLAPHDCSATWRGGDDPSDITIEVPPIGAPGGPPQHTPPMHPAMHAMSAVGHGIVTWTMGYVFRTPPGWNLLCRGPANYPKDGVSPLEGLIESDWAVASFSMNYKFTRPCTAHWTKGEPVAMLVPQRRGELEAFSCRRATLASNAELEAGYNRWVSARAEFHRRQREGDTEAQRQRFQKHYFRGHAVPEGGGPPQDEPFEGHQKGRRLADFDGP